MNYIRERSCTALAAPNSTASTEQEFDGEKPLSHLHSGLVPENWSGGPSGDIVPDFLGLYNLIMKTNMF